jgi:dTDP-4-dehydrorhamnose reductase
MSKIIVLGASGQLGTCLKMVSTRRGIQDIAFPTEEQGNILDMAGLEALFTTHTPQYVINCAAYTAVDKAEDELALARRVNRDGAANLARLCKSHGAVLVHISTDFVFEGNTPRLLTEEDEALPISVYGLTKLEGEQAITDLLEAHYILRTSWLYSEYGNNFVKTMLKLGADRDELSIIADQVGAPTYAIDLADAILGIIETGKSAYGVYHYSNEGTISWYDFAMAIFDISGTQVKVHPITTAQYPTRAMRPAFSAMNKSKIKSTFSMDIPYWRDSLIRCINVLKA